MKQRVALVLLLVVALLATTTPFTAQAQTKLKIGLVQLGTDNPFWIAQVAGGNEAARRYGFELIVTSGEGDVTKQVQAFENLVNQGVNAISINPLDAKAFGRVPVQPDRRLRLGARLRGSREWPSGGPVCGRTAEEEV
jgi:ABC-type sugar transport system substrate-binding protein